MTVLYRIDTPNTSQLFIEKSAFCSPAVEVCTELSVLMRQVDDVLW
jgi:hypothetical protein